MAVATRFDRGLATLVAVIVLLSLPVYMGVVYVEKHAQERLISEVLSIVGGVFENVMKEIEGSSNDGDIVLELFNNEELRARIEDRLSLLVTPEINYVYIVYRDEEGRFRFLADASKEDRGEPGEKIDVFEPEKWNEAFESGREVVIVQEGLRTIGATYLKPILQAGEVKALLVADFSIKKIEEIRGMLDLIRNATGLSSALAVVFLSVSLYQYVRKKRIERSLYIDTLTSLFTRQYIETEGTTLDFGRYHVALIDIDNFRRVNATYGEHAGDMVLKQFADFLRDRLKDSILVRYSGEEFLALIPKEKFQDKSSVIEFLESLRLEVRDWRFSLDGDEVKLTISIGVNISSEKHRTLVEAIKGADRALYRAKREGKDRVEAYDERLEELRRTLSVADVREAIEEGRLVCLYQPIYDLRTEKVSHYEALARIKDSSGNLIAPARFLEDIKGTFLYTRFTKEVIKINVNLLKRRPELEVSINLVPSDMMDDTIMAELLSVEENIRKRLLLEITEAEDIPSFEAVRLSLEELRRVGYRVCIDDFGAGYSNLSNITHLKIDYLKIDGSIIKNITNNEVAKILTETIVNFCNKVGIDVIAEYVETECILTVLNEIGVNYGQGYLFGKPQSL